MRPFAREWRVTTTLQHMQPSAWQFAQAPVCSQGVFVCKRAAFGGQAIACTRLMPASTSVTTLFMPASTITCCGPNKRHARRFELPSMLTSSPSSVMAFVLIKNASDAKCCW